MRRAPLTALAAALALSVALGSLATVHAQRVGEPLPAFELRDQHGAMVTNDDMLGRVWMLNVWASWCPPCRAELPLLARAADELSAEGLDLLLLNAGEMASVAVRFLESEGLSLRTLVDPDRSERGLERTNDALRRLRTGGLPTTYFVDADGTLLATFVGELTPDALRERLSSAFGLDWSP